MLSLLLVLACTADGPLGHPDDTGDDTGPTGGDSGTTDTLEIPGIGALMRNAVASETVTGAQVAVWYQGRVAYTGTWGAAHPDDGGELDDDTLFQVGSIQKHLTAVLALQRVADGSLSLEAHPHDVLGGWEMAEAPGWSEQATLHDLLSHRGGLPDWYPPTTETDDGELLAQTRGFVADELWTLAPPDAFYNYSNANFSLAGAMTEVAGGALWADQLHDDLLVPLGMDRTFARRDDVVADGHYAVGFGQTDMVEWDSLDPFDDLSFEYGTVPIDETWDSAFARPAGLIWSTAADWARFQGFLMNGDDAVLPDDLRERIAIPHGRMYPDADFVGYGYGLVIYDQWGTGAGWNDTDLWLHDGNTFAYSSGVVMVPEHDLAVVVLGSGIGADWVGTALQIADALVEWTPSDSPPELRERPDDVSRWAGRWYDPHVVGEIVITESEGALLVSLPELEAAGHDIDPQLVWVGWDEWAFRIDGWTQILTFWEGPEGEDAHYAASRFYVAEAVAEDAAVPARPGGPSLVLPRQSPESSPAPRLLGVAQGSM